MNILLIYPKNPKTFWNFKKVLSFISKKATFPPLGLLTVAALLPKEWNKKLIDLNVNPLTDKDIMWADQIFISSMIVQKESVKRIIEKCKRFNKTLVAGGPLFNSSHDEFPEINHFILNEAEITLPEYLNDLKHNKTKKIYKTDKFPDITKSPAPLWDLIDFKDYSSMLIQYSRGCPFNCEFCDIIIMNGRVPRTKSPEQVLKELDILFNKGWKGSLFFVDDNFIGNKTKVKEMLKKLIIWQKQKDYPFKIFTEASVNLANDDELLKLMQKANFHKVFLGLETPNIESLKESKKFQNINIDLISAIQKIHRHGMQVLGGFIVGFDKDKEDIFDKQIEFIEKSGVVTAMIGLLIALPKTKLWIRLKNENRLISKTTGQNTDCSLNFKPKIEKEKLISGYKKILKTIYSPNNYYKRINTFLKYYRPTVKSKLTLVETKAFFKSIWQIGIMSKSRFNYLKLIIKTILTNRKAIPIVTELAIIGLHFEEMVYLNTRPQTL